MKILIVDDEPINRSLLANMLLDAGYDDCIEAVDGDVAMALFTQHKPDLVLLDVVMPGCSGYDVALDIRASNQSTYLPILFITALEDKDSLVRCLEVGGNDFVTKPFDKHILIAKIRAHLKIRALSLHVEQQTQALRLFHQRVAREHAIVEHIFSHAIVNRCDVLSHFDYCLHPAETFNGDLFLCEASPSGGIYFVVGDFTGHGLASAIGALPVTRAFQELSQQGVSVSELVTELNAILLQFLPGDMFMAAVVGEINAGGTRVNVWQGGMPSVLIPLKSNMPFRQLPSRHMALGILESDEFNAQYDTMQLNAGEHLVIYSDGLIERTDEHNEMLLEEGFAKLVQYELEETGTLSTSSLIQRVGSFAANEKFDDDVTLVIFISRPIKLTPPQNSMVGLPSVYKVTLNVEHLQQPDVLQRVLQLVGQCDGVRGVRSIMFTILSELFNNALEHGILALDSELKSQENGFHTYYETRDMRLNTLKNGCITVRIESLPRQHKLRLSVEDSGKGFDWKNVSHAKTEVSFGRGIPLIHALCEEVWFDKGGSKVTCLLNTKYPSLS